MRTAEFVSPGHPDKVCDQIADAILDDVLKHDQNARCALEVIGGHGIIFATGEVVANCLLNVGMIAKAIYHSTGYKEPISVIGTVSKQSLEIAQGVNNGGAGDQGIMIGYACSENDEMVPQEYFLARKILKELPDGFGPDAKSQVTLGDDGSVDVIVISALHRKGQDTEPLFDLAKKYNPKHIYINPSGSFTVGGFEADSGCTGRKIVVDAYGPNIPVGGGAFSGKDPTKVDRSGAYMARKIAVDFVKRGAEKALVKIAYAIGKPEPVMADALVDGKAQKVTGWDLRPQAIIERLDLLKPIYRETSKWGHFGNNFVWDK